MQFTEGLPPGVEIAHAATRPAPVTTLGAHGVKSQPVFSARPRARGCAIRRAYNRAPHGQRLRPVLGHGARRARRAHRSRWASSPRRSPRLAAPSRASTWSRCRRRGQARARVHDRRPRPGALGGDPARDRLDPRRAGPRLRRPDPRDAPRRQDRAAQQVPAEDPRRPLDGLHARGRAGLHGDRRRPQQGLRVHDQEEHGRRRLRRLAPCLASATSAPRRRCR